MSVALRASAPASASALLAVVSAADASWKGAGGEGAAATSEGLGEGSALVVPSATAGSAGVGSLMAAEEARADQSYEKAEMERGRIAGDSGDTTHTALLTEKRRCLLFDHGTSCGWIVLC